MAGIPHTALWARLQFYTWTKILLPLSPHQKKISFTTEKNLQGTYVDTYIDKTNVFSDEHVRSTVYSVLKPALSKNY